MKRIAFVLIVCSTLLLVCGCGKYDDEPRASSKISREFSFEAQKRVYPVVEVNDRSYRGKISWDILELQDAGPKPSCIRLSDQIDTLSNGDMIIACDWAKFRVPKEKNWIEVTVTENDTSEIRAVYFATGSHGKVFAPDLCIRQFPKQ